MSKELEALKEIKMSIARHLSKQTGFSVAKHYELLQYDTQIEIIEKALTKLDKIENVIHDLECGKYGFSHEANALHIKDIQNIIKER
jgi:hypothetical protein